MIDSLDPLRLLSLVPQIRRARGFRLYTASGKRLVDLWQYGGRASLGHTPPGVLLAIKDAAARGLACPFPGPYLGRLEKLLSRLVPANPVPRVYPDAAAALRALGGAGLDPQDFLSAPDPATGDLSGRLSCALWRPWLPPPAAPVLRAILPSPWPVEALLLDEKIASSFPPSSEIAPLTLAPVVRAVTKLLEDREAPPAEYFAPLDEALASTPGGVGPVRRGPYLSFPGVAEGKPYADLFRRALARGILLSPDPHAPSIIPPDLSPGEKALLGTFFLGAD